MATPQRYPLIFNPTARSQRGRRALRFLMAHANRFALYATNHSGEARELAVRFAAAGEPAVIAAGGDGTVNEVVAGLAGSDTALGVLPTGTMNVFARELGLSMEDLDGCFNVILRGLSKQIDIFTANGAPFVQMAGVGIDAKVVESTTLESKKVLGPLAYLLAAVRVLGEKPPPLEVVSADGRRETGVAVLAGNGRLYGGQFQVFHQANNQDAKLDVLVFRESGYRLVVDSLRGLAKGRFDVGSDAAYFQTDGFVVRAAEAVPVEVDGELLGRFAETHFALAPSRLRVFAPDAADGSVPLTARNLFGWPCRPADPNNP
jgi:YegS/Rv2252/BmrU family lipid kinase